MKSSKLITKKSWVVALLAAACLSAPAAQAKTMFSLFYNPSMTMPSTGTGGFGPIGFGLGLFFGNRVGLDIGASYQMQLVSGTASPNLNAPIQFRAFLGKVVSIALGGFIDYQLSGLAGGQTALNYGLTGGLGFYFPAGKNRIILEGGYGYGLARVNGTATENLLQMKFGIAFGGGGSN